MDPFNPYNDPFMIGDFNPDMTQTPGLGFDDPFGAIQPGAGDPWSHERAMAAYDGGGYPQDPAQMFNLDAQGVTAEQLQRQTAAQTRYDQAQQMPDYLQGYDSDSAERQRLLQSVGDRQRYADAGDAVAAGLANGSLSSAWLNSMGSLTRGKEKGELAAVEARLKDRTQKSELMTRWTADRKAAADELMYAGGGYGSSSRRSGRYGASTGSSAPKQKQIDLDRIKATANHYAPIIAENEGGAKAMNAAIASNSYEAIDMMLGRYSEEYRNAQEGGGWGNSTGDDAGVEINRYTQQKRRLLTEEGKLKMVQKARESVISNWSRLSEMVKDPRIKSEIDSLVDVVRATVYSDPRIGVDPQQAENTGGDGDAEVLNRLENLFKVGGFSEGANESAGRLARNSINELRQVVQMKTGTMPILNTGNMYGGAMHGDLTALARGVKSDSDVNDVFDMIRSQIIATEERYPSNAEIQATFTAMRNGPEKTTTDAAGNTNAIASSKAAGVSVAGPGAPSVRPEPMIPWREGQGPDTPARFLENRSKPASQTDTILGNGAGSDSMAEKMSNKGGVGSGLRFIHDRLLNRWNSGEDAVVKGGKAFVKGMTATAPWKDQSENPYLEGPGGGW